MSTNELYALAKEIDARVRAAQQRAKIKKRALRKVPLMANLGVLVLNDDGDLVELNLNAESVFDSSEKSLASAIVTAIAEAEATSSKEDDR